VNGRDENIRMLTLSEGRHPFRMHAFVCGAGNDIQIFVVGGTSPHIGSVAISQSRRSLNKPGQLSCTTSVHNILGHKDDRISVMFSEAFCREFSCLVAVSAGVHLDDATPEDTEKLMRVAERLLKKSVSAWRQQTV
jgi:hypothetical protein